MKRIIFAAAAALAAFTGCSREEQNLVIEIGGSTSVVPVIELLANAFQEENAEIRINVHSTGSSDGIRNAGGLYEIGMSSRPLTPAELGAGLNERIIAIDGIAVIVHHTSPITDLNMEQIRGIYTGAITDWSQVSAAKSGAIAVVTREEGSGTRGAFEEMVEFQGQLRAGAVEGPSTGAVRSNVAGNPSAIGYISIGSVDGSVRAIAINGAEPTAANMLAGAYGIARPFILLYRDLGPAGRQFLDWITSDGQALVARSWVPVN